MLVLDSLNRAYIKKLKLEFDEISLIYQVHLLI